MQVSKSILPDELFQIYAYIIFAARKVRFQRQNCFDFDVKILHIFALNCKNMLGLMTKIPIT